MIGVMWALLGGCSFGLSNVFARMSMERVSPATAVYWSVALNTVLFAPVALARLPEEGRNSTSGTGI